MTVPTSLLVGLWGVTTLVVFYLIYRRLAAIRDEVSQSTTPLTAHSNTDAPFGQVREDTQPRPTSPTIQAEFLDPEIMVCQACGTLNERDYWFCENCISPLHRY